MLEKPGMVPTAVVRSTSRGIYEWRKQLTTNAPAKRQPSHELRRQYFTHKRTRWQTFRNMIRIYLETDFVLVELIFNNCLSCPRFILEVNKNSDLLWHYLVPEVSKQSRWSMDRGGDIYRYGVIAKDEILRFNDKTDLKQQWRIMMFYINARYSIRQ